MHPCCAAAAFTSTKVTVESCELKASVSPVGLKATLSTQPYEGVSKRTVPNLGSVPKGEACPLPSRFLSHAEKMRHLKSVD